MAQITYEDGRTVDIVMLPLAGVYTWKAALSACRAQTTDGRRWRLPTAEELAVFEINVGTYWTRTSGDSYQTAVTFAPPSNIGAESQQAELQVIAVSVL